MTSCRGRNGGRDRGLASVGVEFNKKIEIKNFKL